jgi:hypothetical protein
MLGPGRYLLGIAELLLLAGFAVLGASRVRSRLLPTFRGAPAHLATTLLALTLLIWAAELLGTISLLKPVPYVFLVVAIGLTLRLAVPAAGGAAGGTAPEEALATGRGGGSPAATGPAAGTARPTPKSAGLTTWIALSIAAIALLLFAWQAKSKLTTGMTGFDSTWYHAPFAAGFLQTGNTIDLHFIAPQFLAWFYPANGEIFHAIGMLAFDRDLLSPLLNVAWFGGCLLACWCVGRPYGVAPWSLALGALALSVPALSDQAGEARNDIVGIFFLTSAVAVTLNAACAGSGEERGWSTGALVVVGLAAGLAAGTKLNFLLPAGVLVLGVAAIAPRGGRWRALFVASLAALAGGGYWYLRNLVHTGNPLPWAHHLGPIDLPAPAQALGGREAHSVASYLFDGSVWSDWFLPGLHSGLWIVWPLLIAAALAGLLLPLVPLARRPGSADRALAAVAVVGLATVLAWLLAPTSASGPDGMPRGFESGLRYLAPALVLGLALLPTVGVLRERLAQLGTTMPFVTHRVTNERGVLADVQRKAQLPWGVAAAGALALAVLVGYPVQRHYLGDRYADPTFTTPGLNAAFAWARDVSGARIATTSTRQYPLFGTDLSNHVDFIGEQSPHGGFEAPTSCRQFRRLVNEGHYDYLVATRDRLEPNKPAYPPSVAWASAPSTQVVLKKPPTVVYQLRGNLDPLACR